MSVSVVTYCLLDGPGTTGMAEPRSGLLLALAASIVLLASTATVAAAPSRRKVATKPYVPPPPAPVYDPDHWGPPQF